MALPSITETQILGALGLFLQNILPPGVEVIRSQVNRVASPTNPFVSMTPLSRMRLATSENSSADVAFVGTIAGATLTVTELLAGQIAAGQAITGPSIAADTTITGFQSGVGGTGTYTVAPTQTVATPTTMQAGTTNVLMRTDIAIQLDIYGDGAADNAQVIATLFRDDYAVSFLSDPSNFPSGGFFEIAPLYTTDPRQTPFIGGEQQYQERWSMDAHIQVNPVVSTAQQYADAVTIVLVNVDAAYPPA